jgi:hypothetical protein
LMMTHSGYYESEAMAIPFLILQMKCLNAPKVLYYLCMYISYLLHYYSYLLHCPITGSECTPMFCPDQFVYSCHAKQLLTHYRTFQFLEKNFSVLQTFVTWCSLHIQVCKYQPNLHQNWVRKLCAHYGPKGSLPCS